jgi:His-Xaa-Ser system protein HxsD
MDHFTTTLAETSVELTFDERLYPRDAVYGAAYVFIDRCYVHLDRAATEGGGARIHVTLRAKGKAADVGAYAAEFKDELLGQAWRRHIVEIDRDFFQTLAIRALGAPGAEPTLDDLLAGTDEGAFEDPLGIAMSWEEKYTKKKGGDEAEAAPGAPATEQGTKEASS